MQVRFRCLNFCLALAVVSFTVGCAGPGQIGKRINDSEIVLNKFVEANPRWEALTPGTIVLVQKGNSAPSVLGMSWMQAAGVTPASDIELMMRV